MEEKKKKKRTKKKQQQKKKKKEGEKEEEEEEEEEEKDEEVGRAYHHPLPFTFVLSLFLSCWRLGKDEVEKRKGVKLSEND